MSITKSDLKVGAVLVLLPYTGSVYGYQLVEKQLHYVDGESQCYWVYRAGKVDSGKFVPGTEPSSLVLEHEDAVLGTFNAVWTEEPTFKEGDVLIATNGTIVIAGKFITYGQSPNVQQFWYGRHKGGWDRRETVEREHGKLSKLMNNLGETFTGVKIQ